MKKLLIAALLWVGLAQAGFALTVEERLLANLQGQGYTVLEKGYTFLGRLRIVAENGEIHREIVVNPGTGEILRDYAVYLTDLPLALPEAQVATRATKTGHLAVAATDAGTADVAAMALSPGTSTLGSADIQVDNTKESLAPLDSIMLPMTPDAP